MSQKMSFDEEEGDDQGRAQEMLSSHDEALEQIETNIVIDETTLESFHSKLTSIQKEMDEEELRLEELQWEVKVLEDRQGQLKSQQAVNVELVKSMEGTLRKVIDKLRHKLDSTRTTLSLDSQGMSNDDDDDEEEEDETTLAECEERAGESSNFAIEKVNDSEEDEGEDVGQDGVKTGVSSPPSSHRPSKSWSGFVTVPVRLLSTKRLRKQVVIIQREVSAQRKLWKEREQNQNAGDATGSLLKGAPRLPQELEGSVLHPPTSVPFFSLPARLAPLTNEEQSKRDTLSYQQSGIEETDDDHAIDPHVVLCPYDLSGTCADDSCPYQHLTPRNATIRRRLHELPVVLPPMKLPPVPFRDGDDKTTDGHRLPQEQDSDEHESAVSRKRRRQTPGEEENLGKRTQLSTLEVTGIVDRDGITTASGEGLQISSVDVQGVLDGVDGTKAREPRWENNSDFILLPREVENSDDEFQSLDTNTLEESSEGDDDDEMSANATKWSFTEREDILWYLRDAEIHSILFPTDSKPWDIPSVLAVFGFHIVAPSSCSPRKSSLYTSNMMYRTNPNDTDVGLNRSIKMVAKAVTMMSYCLHSGRKDLMEAVTALVQEYLSHNCWFRDSQQEGIHALLVRIMEKLVEWISVTSSCNTTSLSSLQRAFSTQLALGRLGALLRFYFHEGNCQTSSQDIVAEHSHGRTQSFITLLSEPRDEEPYDRDLCQATASVVQVSFSGDDENDGEGAFMRRVLSHLCSTSFAGLGAVDRDVASLLGNCVVVGRSVARGISEAANAQDIDPQVITDRIVEPLWLEVKRYLFIPAVEFASGDRHYSHHNVLQAIAVMGPVLLSWVSECLRLLSVSQAKNCKSEVASRYESSPMNWDGRSKGVLNGLMVSLDSFVKQLQTLVDRSGMTFEYAGLLCPLHSIRSSLAVAAWSFAKAHNILTSCLSSDRNWNGPEEPMKRHRDRQRLLLILKESANASSSLLWSQLVVLRSLFPESLTSDPNRNGYNEEKPRNRAQAENMDQPIDRMFGYGVYLDELPMLGDSILLEHHTENSALRLIMRLSREDDFVCPEQDSRESHHQHGITVSLNDTSLYGGGCSLFPRSLLVCGHRLASLEMARCSLTSLPFTIGSYLEKLRSLDLEDNDIEALPASVCDLGQLESLNVSRNYLEALPDAIGDLDMLRELRASHNKLGSLPVSLGRCQRLKILDVKHNRIQHVASDLPLMLPSLQALELEGNPVERMA